ncbi:MAG TPA: XRE family transcriptional regulator [Steroidobacteraceae bacterium]|jgi:transcriptional regulator with XRE-family HTH domain|nr:XRE family transcriptional regulator [Steroidobacteraceae bacterium]
MLLERGPHWDMNNRPASFTLGKRLSSIRAQKKWTLREMSLHTGIPSSTLAKVEHGRLTLTYDKLVQISQRLNVRVSEFFADQPAIEEQSVTARRSVDLLKSAACLSTEHADYYYLCQDLRGKRMIPILMKVRRNGVRESANLARHSGEEFVYMLSGSIRVLTEFYNPATLNEGESIYIDSTMGHAYVIADGCDEAMALVLCSSADVSVVDSLFSSHGVVSSQRRAQALYSCGGSTEHAPCCRTDRRP